MSKNTDEALKKLTVAKQTITARQHMEVMFGRVARHWTHEELVFHTRSVTLDQLADYPHLAKPLCLWLSGL